MAAYAFHLTGLVAIVVLTAAILAPSRWMRFAVAIPLAILVVCGLSLLIVRDGWLVASAGTTDTAIDLGRQDEGRALAIVTTSEEGGDPALPATLRADRTLTLFDPTMPDASSLLLQSTADGGSFRVTAVGSDAPLYISGEPVFSGDEVQLESTPSVLKWGASHVELRVDRPVRRFTLPFLLLAVLLGIAAAVISRDGTGAVWVALLAFVTYAFVIHARLGIDHGRLTASRMVVATAAFIALAAVSTSSRRLWHSVAAVVFGVAAVLAASGPAIVGRPTWIEQTVLCAIVIAGTAPRAVARLLTSPAGERMRAWLFERAPVSLADLGSLILLAALPLVVAFLGHKRLPGRFLLVVAVLWFVSRAIEGLGVIPIEPKWAELGVPVALMAMCVVPIVLTDFGFGATLAIAVLAIPVVAAPRRWGPWVGILVGVAIVSFAIAYSCGVLSSLQEGRFLFLLNPVFGPGSGLHEARIAFQEGALWGHAWWPGGGVVIPEWDADFVVAAMAYEVGLLGLLWAAGLFVLAVAALVLRAASADFDRDRDRARTVWLWATAVSVWMVLMAAVNLSGTTGVFPLTGVPVVGLSRSGDALVALGLVAAVVSLATRPGRTVSRLRLRDVRIVGAIVLSVGLLLVAIGVERGGRLAVAWLDLPDARWHELHQFPMAGRIFSIHRELSTHFVPSWKLEVLGRVPVEVNDQPFRRGDSVRIQDGAEIGISGMLFVFHADQWDPRVVLLGWDIDPGRTSTTIGRAAFHQRLWPLDPPGIHLSWDGMADFNAGAVGKSDGTWVFTPAPSAYRGVELTSGDGSRLVEPLRLPRTPEEIDVRFGFSVLAFSVQPDDQLRARLTQPAVTFDLSKAGSTFFGGSRMAHDPSFTPGLLVDMRAAATIRALLEAGAFALNDDGSLTLAETKGMAGEAAWYLRQLFGGSPGGPVVIPAEAVESLPDGRPAGIRRGYLCRRVGSSRSPLSDPVLVDAHDRVLPIDPLGLRALVGYPGVTPGLTSLTKAQVMQEPIASRLSFFYPLTGGKAARVFPLRTSLIPELQLHVVEGLRDWSKVWAERATRADANGLTQLTASAVVIDEQSRIVAMASTPYAQDERELKHALNAPGYDPRVVVQPLEPIQIGSIGKIEPYCYLLGREPEFFENRGGELFFLTWVRTSRGVEMRVFSDPGTVSEWLGRRVPPVSNARRAAYGVIPFWRVVQKSTNTHGVAPLARLTDREVDDLLVLWERMGFRPTELVPAPFRDPGGRFEPFLYWHGRNRALQLPDPEPFGNVAGGAAGRSLPTFIRFHLGDLSNVTPLHAAVVFNTVASGGLYYPPQLITGLGVGDDVVDFAPPEGERVLEPEVASRMAFALRQVARADGTAAAAFRGSFLLGTQYDLMVKTGTPEKKRAEKRGGRIRLRDDRADKVVVASARVPGTATRYTVFVHVKAAGEGGPGQHAIDPLGAQRFARSVLEQAVAAQ